MDDSDCYAGFWAGAVIVPFGGRADRRFLDERREKLSRQQEKQNLEKMDSLGAGFSLRGILPGKAGCRVEQKRAGTDARRGKGNSLGNLRFREKKWGVPGFWPEGLYCQEAGFFSGGKGNIR